MKIISLFIILISIAVSLGCYSQNDCKVGYCCTGGITPWMKGSCMKLAEEGELCDQNPPSTGKYFMRCPCIEGLKCEGNEKVISKKSPLCVKE